MKKVLSVVLLLILVLLSVTACGNTTGIEDKWVLINEKTQNAKDIGTSNYTRFTEYQYDANGKIVGETIDYPAVGVFVGEDFKYDESGNVISKTLKLTYEMSQNESLSYYTYSYDSENNLISQEVHYDSSENDYSIYSYDEKGNIIKEKNTYNADYDTIETIYNYKLKYENGLCLESEIIVDETNQYGKSTRYILEQYKYDENGNKTEEIYYTGVEEISEAEISIEVNGKYYEHYSTTFYSYAKLTDVAVKLETEDQTNNKNALSSMSKWGFENSEKWGNEFLKIVSTEENEVIFKDEKGTYVIIQEGSSLWEFYPKEGQVLLGRFYFEGSNIKGSGNYTVLDNNTISLSSQEEGNGALRITDRIIKDDIIVFVIDNNGSEIQYYIPYEMLDLKESPTLYKDGGKYDFYKVYVK